MHILLCLCLIFTAIYGPSSVAGITGNGTGYIDWTQGMAKFHFTEIADLKRRLDSLESNSAVCRKESDERQAEIKELQERLEQIEYKCNDEKLAPRAIDTDEQIKELREILEHKECRCDDRKLAPRAIGDESSTLAFYAWLERNMSDIGTGMTVIFDTVITNIGGRYNGKTGIFYCDKPGLYFFSVSVMAHQGKYIALAMVVNGAAYMLVLADASGSGDYETGSNSGVIELQNGDSVWVRVWNHVKGDTDNIIYAGWTTFTGYFIKEIS